MTTIRLIAEGWPRVAFTKAQLVSCARNSMSNCRLGGWRERGRPVAAVVLTDEERETLQRWARRAKSSQALAQRCRIVLGCAAGKSNKEVAAEVGCVAADGRQVAAAVRGVRLDGLADEPRPGAPRMITDEQVEEVVVATLERQPKDATHWSRASMAAETGLSKSTVGRIWKAFGLKPHQVDTFKISNDPQFIDKVRDVVGLYLDPPEKALVLCVDEKSQIQALDRSAPVLPMMPGMPTPSTSMSTSASETVEEGVVIRVAPGLVSRVVRGSSGAARVRRGAARTSD